MTEYALADEINNPSSTSILCTCPNCESGDLMEHRFSWICECDFKLHKQQRGRTMSREELHQLASTGTTGLLHDFVSKEKGTKYAAVLKLERDDNDQMRVMLVFPVGKKYACPCCASGSLTEKGKLYECECGFKLWKSISSKNLTDKQIEDLLTKGITQEIKGFISKAGKTFDAKLKLDMEAKHVKFDF